jgi:hypothetical protein
MSGVHALALPAKLDDGYTCRGTDANGEQFTFEDLLELGEKVGTSADDKGNVWGPFGVVVRRVDELWIVADERHQEARP